MIWYKSIGNLEIVFICLFSLFYLAYMVRMFYIVNKLKASLSSLYLKLIIRSCYFALAVIALLGPSFGDFKKEISSVSKNIYFAIDISSSMNCRDLAPSRLEKVKFEIEHMARRLSGERMGIIIYSSEAFIHCPLTYDLNAFLLFLRSVNTNLIPSHGSNPAAALELANGKFSEINKEKNNIGVLVLVSDGEDPEEQLQDEINRVKKQMQIFLLGTGTEEGGKIPEGNSYKRDMNGHWVKSSLQKSFLESLSRSTGAKYYELSDESNEIPLLTEKIHQIKGVSWESKKIDSTANKYLYFLLSALFLIIIDVLITVRTVKI